MEESPKEIALTENGKALYAVVRAENADEDTVNAAVEFRRRLEEKAGVKFSFGTDWTKPGKDPDTETPEILFGITNRTAQNEADALGIMEWKIVAEQNKIAVLARSSRALKEAMEVFLSEEVTVRKGDSLLLCGIPITGTASLAAGEVPDFPYGKIEGIYESSGSTVVMRVEETTADEYEAYLGMLEAAGFAYYDGREIDGNRYATYVNEQTTVNVSRVQSMGVTRVVSEERGELCPLEDPCEEKADSLLTGMKGETVVAAEGMGFIIRLADGSFCIIDGGMGDPDSVDSDKLMNILLSQKPADVEKPVIAAWLFTHLHGDHIGVFNCFSLDHHDDVIIERLVFNFPKYEETRASDSPYMLDDTIYRYTQFRKNLADFYADVPILKVHTGNRFQVRNASFEVLYTLEDLYPKSILTGGMNECSILYKMTLGGQTTLWTGDIAFNATDLVLEEFTDALQCDILQIAHHGFNGTVAFYSRVNPTYALWPVWEGGFESMRGNAQNKWLIDSEKVRQIIVTGVGTWTIRLPYDPVDGTFDRTPTRRTKYPSYPDLLGE
ncbi:MAG: hypothetical protein IK132_11315 [Clostridia bacterium]|nr:hypothetical protein [Clostridia bacterium]